MSDSEIYGCTGKVLRVDLSSGDIGVQDVSDWVPLYFGGRGLAARIAWEEIPPGLGAFDPRNPLMIMAGALAGTPAPSSGRVTVCGVSPQTYPQEWFTRSSMGGHWGAELKYAGYDGVVVTGASERPVLLWIEDERVEVRDAAHLWGLGIFDTQKQLFRELGKDVRILTIGPAGEHLSRIAVVATATETAAGQGGFGAVMGAKKLKALAVRGHGAVRIADAKETLARCQRIVQAWFPKLTGPSGAHVERYGQRYYACTQCPRGCSIYQHVPGVVHKDKVYSGQYQCCAPGLSKYFPKDIQFEAGFEVAQIANDYGLNHWEFCFGFGPWIQLCQERGELLEIEGDRMDLSDPAFWAMFLRRIAFREGWGEAFAEGGRRAPGLLGVGGDLIERFYPAWGHASHWDGHGSFGGPHFPYWLVTGLQWAMDTRDPMGGGHGYTSNFTHLARRIGPEDWEGWEKVRRLSTMVYGAPGAADPRCGYEGKAHAASFHCDRNALKDTLGICDNIFPLLVDAHAEDLLPRVNGVIGPSLEYYLSEPVMGTGRSEEQFYRTSTRIFTLERALQIRNWERTRATDETVIAYLSYPEVHPSPFLGERVGVDPEQFRHLMDEFYDLRGWDRRTGWPTYDTLKQLGIEEIADGMAPAGKIPDGNRRGGTTNEHK